jgi:hypothetical protein
MWSDLMGKVFFFGINFGPHTIRRLTQLEFFFQDEKKERKEGGRRREKKKKGRGRGSLFIS